MSLSKGASSFEKGCDAESGPICGACREVGVQRQGEKFCIDCGHFLCTACIDCHSKFKSLKEHKIVKTTSNDTTDLAKVMASCLSCPNHPDKTVEVVCKSHDVLCCHTCATVAHGECNEVVEITSETAKRNLYSETDEAKDHLAAAKSHIENIIENHSTSITEFVSVVDDSLPKKLKALKQKLIKALDQLEKNIISETEQKKWEHVAKRTEQISKWSKHKDIITESQNLLASMQENGSDTHLYVVMHKIKKELSDIDDSISALGFHMKHEKIEMNETQAVQTILLSNARGLVTLPVVEQSVPLPKYKYEKKRLTSKSAVGNNAMFRQGGIFGMYSSSQQSHMDQRLNRFCNDIFSEMFK